MLLANPQSKSTAPAGQDLGKSPERDIVTALALSIGLLGGVATYLYLSDPLVLGLQIWAAFIAWASFYHCGGKIQGFMLSILANLWRVVTAARTLLVVPRLGFAEQLGRPFWAGICVAICGGVAVMILGAKIPIFSAIPATVYGYAATVALTLLSADGLANLSQPTLLNPAVIIALSMIGGAIFGLISEALAGLLARSA